MIELRGSKKASTVPFPAIVGQERLKRALLAVAANDRLDGLLVRGEKGTAKSTAVRALVDLLPDQRAVADCPYGCPPDDPRSQCSDCRDRTDPPVETRPVPLVTLPLGATRERVVGTLSVADALDGEAEFDPGLLARANRGILYVDEVNLLDDHLVDVLLDAAASGVNRVERDGVSVSHPADFTLVGTMNPEEGDLRPQLKDRFALQATVTGCEAIDDRVEILDRALDGTDLDARFADETDALRDRLLDAHESLADVALPREFREDIVELCRDAGVEGHRADIAVARAARTFAALDGRPKVIESDVRSAAELALPHRLKSRPFEDAPDPDDVLDDHFDGEDDADGEGGDSADGEGGDGADGEGEDGKSGDESETGPDESAGEDSDERGDAESDGSEGGDSPDSDPRRDDRPGRESPAEAGAGGDGDDSEGGESEDDGSDSEGGDSDDSEEGVPLVPGQARPGVGDAERPEIDGVESDESASGGDGSDGTRAAAAPSADGRGARVRTERADATDASDPVDAAASVRAAAARGADAVTERDLRTSVRAREESALVVFAVDASVSMRPAMRAAKGTVLELLKDAYERRDEVAFVAFAGEDAEVLLPPTDSTELAARHLKDLPVADRTPLPAGLRTASEVVERADAATSVVVVVTDGKANVADGSPTEATRRAARRLGEQGCHTVVVDASDGGTGLADVVVEQTDGERVPLSDLTPERVTGAVRRAESDAGAGGR